MPGHHRLAVALYAYIAAAGIAEDRKGSLFLTSREPAGRLTHNAPPPASWRKLATIVFA